MRGVSVRGLSSSQVSDWHNNASTTLTVPSRRGSLYPTEGLICHIAASAIGGLSDGDTLPATISDLSAAGNDASRVNSPTYQTGETPSGGAAMRSSNGYLTLPGTMWSGKTAGHIFAYVKSIPTGSEIVNGPWHMGGEYYSFYPFSDGNLYEAGLSASNQSRYSGAPVAGVRGVWRVYEIEHSSGTRIIRIDGSQQASESKTFGPSTSPRLLGGAYQTDDNLMIAEFMAYDATLSSTDAARVRAYLTGKHGATG